TSQYIGIFIDESTEHLDTLYEQLLELEKNPTEKQYIEEIFRAAHTLKGMSATMGFEDLAKLTHKLENIFDGIRYDRLTVYTEMMDFLFTTVDALNEMVEDVSNGGDGTKDVTEMMAQLDKLEKGERLSDESSGTTNVVNAEVVEDTNIQLDEFQLTILQESKDKGFHNYELYVRLREDCLLKGARVFMIFEILEKSGEIIYSNPPANELEEENFDLEFRVIFVSKEVATELEDKLKKVSEVDEIMITNFTIKQLEHGAKEKQKNKQAPAKTIRINIDRLDVLMNLFEELVIDRGRLEQISLDLKNNELQETVERMSRVSSDLQNIILTMRMVPIDTVFNRFP